MVEEEEEREVGVGQVFIYLPLHPNFLRIKVSKIEKENDIPTMVEEEEEVGGRWEWDRY